MADTPSAEIDFQWVGSDEQILLLPPEEKDGRRTRTVQLAINNATRAACKIEEYNFADPNLERYFNLDKLIGQEIPPGAQVTFAVTLSNRDNPKDLLPGQVQIKVRWENTDAIKDPWVHFQLRPFPTYQGVFAMDYGTTNSTCVVLPSKADISDTRHFRALNLQDAKKADPEPEAEHPSAVMFKQIAGEIEHWDVEVGRTVLETFSYLLESNDPTNWRKTRAVHPSGLKRLLGNDKEKVPITSLEAGGYETQISGNEANGKVLQRFVRRCEEYSVVKQALPLGKITEVVATHPVNFTPQQITALRQAYSRFLGIDPEMVITRYDEATAAAIHFLAIQLFGRIHEFWARCDQVGFLPPDGDAPELRVFNMLVFDCGGGTTDIALMRVEVERRLHRQDNGKIVTTNWFEIRPQVIGLTGEKHFAGDNITLAAFKLLRYRLAERIVRKEGVRPDPARWPGARDQFDDTAAEFRDKLKEGREAGQSELAFIRAAEEYSKFIIPTDYKSVPNQQSEPYRLRRYAFFKMWELAEQAKIALTTKEACEVSIRDLSLLEAYHIGEEPAEGERTTLKGQADFSTLSISRAELDGLIRDDVVNVWALARDLCLDLREKRNPKEKVHQVVLAGNGSRYPLIEKVMRETFADGKIFAYQKHRVLEPGPDAKRAVAKGAATAEWYRRYKPGDIKDPDQSVVAFRIDAEPVLPFGLKYRAAEELLKIFDRGEPFNGREALEWRGPAPEGELAIFQVVCEHGQQRREVAHSIFNLARAPRPTSLPETARPEVVVTINREYEVRASLQWKDGAQAIGEPIPLTAAQLPPDYSADQKNPSSGLH